MFVAILLRIGGILRAGSRQRAEHQIHDLRPERLELLVELRAQPRVADEADELRQRLAEGPRVLREVGCRHVVGGRAASLLQERRGEADDAADARRDLPLEGWVAGRCDEGVGGVDEALDGGGEVLRGGHALREDDVDGAQDLVEDAGEVGDVVGEGVEGDDAVLGVAYLLHRELLLEDAELAGGLALGLLLEHVARGLHLHEGHPGAEEVEPLVALGLGGGEELDEGAGGRGEAEPVQRREVLEGDVGDVLQLVHRQPPLLGSHHVGVHADRALLQHHPPPRHRLLAPAVLHALVQPSSQ